MHRSASVPPVAMSPRWYALPASLAHHCGPLLGRTVQPRTPGECRRRNSRTATPDLEHRGGDKRSRTPTANATAEISIRAHTPGSAGALAGMIFRASTDLSITGKRSHNPPDHDDAFAPIGRRGRQRSQDEYPRPTGRNSRSATPNWEHHRGESRSASPNREHHRGDKRPRTPTANTTAEIPMQPRTPGSTGALAGMILHASTDLSITGKRSHNLPDHDAAFAPIGRRGSQRSQDEYPRPTGRNSSSASPDGEHRRGDCSSASPHLEDRRGDSRSGTPNLEDHRGHRRSATHPWERRRPRRHDPPCPN